jgi:hypothetical protein
VIGLQKDRAREEGYYWLCIVQEIFLAKGELRAAES